MTSEKVLKNIIFLANGIYGQDNNQWPAHIGGGGGGGGIGGIGGGSPHIYTATLTKTNSTCN